MLGPELQEERPELDNKHAPRVQQIPLHKRSYPWEPLPRQEHRGTIDLLLPETTEKSYPNCQASSILRRRSKLEKLFSKVFQSRYFLIRLIGKSG